MDVNTKDLKAVQRIRNAYKDSETAFDALIYILLTEGGTRTGDVSSRIKQAVAFCRDKEGQAYYERVVEVLEETPDEIYDYSRALAKAARQHKEGQVSPSPEMLLSKFQKKL